MSEKAIAKKPHFPDGMAIVMSFTLLAWLLSFVIPSGTFERIADPVTGRNIVDAASFHFVDKSYLSLIDLLSSLHNGFVSASDMIIMTFLIGGAFSVARKIGIIDIMIKRLAYHMRNKSIWVIPMMMILISLMENFLGTPEICLIFIPILMPLFLSLGFDAMTACGAVLISECIGFTVSFANPFTVIIGQKLAGLPLYSGFAFRFIAWALSLAVAILFVASYGKKVQANPAKSLVYDPAASSAAVAGFQVEDAAFTLRQKLAGIAFLLIFSGMLISIIFFEMLDIAQMDAFFLLMCIVPGMIAGLSSKELVDAVMKGAKSVMYGAFMMAVARSVSTILTASGTVDTIVYYLSGAVSQLPSYLAVIGMQLVQSVMNFVIPSGSGQAIVTLPILLPLSDVVGITNQTAIIAFQYGDGLANIIVPNSGILFACLALGNITYNKWLKWFGKFFIFQNIMSFGVLIIAHLIQWGPF